MFMDESVTALEYNSMINIKIEARIINFPYKGRSISFKVTNLLKFLTHFYFCSMFCDL